MTSLDQGLSATLSLAAATAAVAVFRPERCVIDPDRILRLQRYRELDKVRPAIRKAAEAMARRANEIMSPEVHYRSVAVDCVTENGLLLENGTALLSGAFHHFFDGAQRAVAIIVTLGRRLDHEVVGMIDRFEPLEALLLETAGWLGIESASKAFADCLRRSAAPEGLHATVRMAPGYTYRIGGAEVSWPLEQQREIFDLFSGHELPVQLLSSCAMTPKMSRSGIYGLVPSDLRRRRLAPQPKDTTRSRNHDTPAGRDASPIVAVPPVR
jgi:hypothetical protein